MNKINIAAKSLILLIIAMAMFNSASALGIAPSRIVQEFKANLHQEYTFSILNGENSNLDVIVYPKGELADFVSTQNTTLHIPASKKETKVTYRVDIPFSSRRPGTNLVEVVVEEVPENINQQTALGGRVAVVHQLVLNSPSNGKEASVRFDSDNPDFDKSPEFSYALFNEGTEDINSISADVEVFDSNSHSVAKKHYDFNPLAAGETRKEQVSLEKNLMPGSYKAVTSIYYDGRVINQEVNFNVGGLYINLDGLSSPNFNLGSINKIDLFLSNKLSRDVNGVFAEVSVKDANGNIIKTFKTVSGDLSADSEGIISGYLDTSGMSSGTYYLSIQINYEGKEITREIGVKLFQNEFIPSESKITGNAVLSSPKPGDHMIGILILSLIALIIVNIIIIIYIRKGRQPPTSPYMTNLIIFANIILVGILFKLANHIL